MYLRTLAGLVIGVPVAAYILLVPESAFADYGTLFTNPVDTILLAAGFSATVMLGSWVASKRSKDPLALSPHPVHEWSTSLLWRGMVSWVVYLVPYEFVLRGFFLLYCTSIMPEVWAISINVALYALAHLPKNIRETVLSVPFGVLLCLITLQTGNIWATVAVHLALAITNDYLFYQAALKQERPE